VSAEDNRRKFCAPTEKGRAFVRKYHANMQHAQDNLLRPLKPAERVEFMRLLRRVVEAGNDLGRAPLRPSAQRGDAAKAATKGRPRTRSSKRNRG
jgi:hypothetical protein